MKIRKFLFSAALAVTSVATLSAASSFSGKARMRFGLQNYTQENNSKIGDVTFGLYDKSSVDAQFFLNESTKNAKGDSSKGAYADVEAYAKFRVKMVDLLPTGVWQNVGDSLKYKIGFNKADFVFDDEKNFKFSIIGKSPMSRYSRGWEVEIDEGNLIQTEPFVTNSTAFYKLPSTKDYRDTTYSATKNPKGNYARARGGYMPNVALSYDKYSLSLGLDGGWYDKGNYVDGSGTNAKSNKVDYLVLAKAEDIKLSDSASISAQAGVFNSHRMTLGQETTTVEGKEVRTNVALGQQTHVLYGGKFAYKTEKLSVEAGATGNVRVNKGGAAYTDVDEANAVEASLNVDYHDDVAVGFDAWFLDNQGLWSDDNEPDYVTYDNRSNLGFVYRDKDGYIYRGSAGSGENNRTLHKALSMRLKAKPAKDVSTIITMQDVLNQGIYGFQVPVKVGNSLTITPAFEYTVNTSKIYEDGKWIMPSGTAEKNSIVDGRIECFYGTKNISIFGYVRLGKESGADKMFVKPYIDISSKTIIDGAVLRFRWSDANFGGAATAPSGMFHYGNGLGKMFFETRINFR